MNSYKDEVKEKIIKLMKKRENNEIELRKVIFDYCKYEGLVAASREFSIDKPIAYKKIIREEFDLVI